MPKNGENRPIVVDMVAKNQRLIIFTSNSYKEATEGIDSHWKYVVENQCKYCSLSGLVSTSIISSIIYMENSLGCILRHSSL